MTIGMLEVEILDCKVVGKKEKKNTETVMLEESVWRVPALKRQSHVFQCQVRSFGRNAGPPIEHRRALHRLILTRTCDLSFHSAVFPHPAPIPQAES